MECIDRSAEIVVSEAGLRSMVSLPRVVDGAAQGD